MAHLSHIFVSSQSSIRCLPRHFARPNASHLGVTGALLTLLLTGLPSHAQTQPPVPATTINDLKARISREYQTLTTAGQIVARTSLPLVRGHIMRRENGGVLVWGRASGDPRLSSRLTPEMDTDSNILVVQPDARGFAGETYLGNHAYVGQRTALNAYGRKVPVYIYGPPPRSYVEAKKRIAGAQAHLVTLRQTLVARFFTLSKQQVGDQLKNRQGAVEQARVSLELQRFLAQRGLQAPELEARAIALQTRVATGDARAGHLSKAMEMLSALLGYKATRAPNLLRPQTEGLNIADMDETSYHAANSSPTFPATPQTYFALHPELYSGLLGAWSQTLPAYLNTANPTMKAQALRWSRILVDNAGIVPRTPIPTEAVSIEGVLTRARSEALEKSGQKGVVPSWDFVKLSDTAPEGKVAPAGVAGVWVTFAEGSDTGFGDPDEDDYVFASGEREYRPPHLHTGDLLTSFNGQPTASMVALEEQLRLVQSSQSVLVGVYRHGRFRLLRTRLY